MIPSLFMLSNRLSNTKKMIAAAAFAAAFALSTTYNSHQIASGDAPIPGVSVEYQGELYHIYDGTQRRAIQHGLYQAADSECLDGIVDQVFDQGPIRMTPGTYCPIPIISQIQREVRSSDQERFDKVFKAYQQMREQKTEQDENLIYYLLPLF